MRLTKAQQQALRLAAEYPNVKASWYWIDNGANALTLNSLHRRGLLSRIVNTQPSRYSITDAGRQWIKDNTND